jgi:hypothetical protein
LNNLERKIKILIYVFCLILDSFLITAQPDSNVTSIQSNHKRFTNHLDFSSSNSYFRRLENVIKANYIVGIYANHKMILNRNSTRNFFLSYGLNFQYQFIKFVDVFRELKENESIHNSNSIEGHKDAKFIFGGINFSWGYLFNYNRMQLELFQRSTLSFLLSTNADNYNYSKDYGCTPPGVPSHCYKTHNSIIYAKSMFPLEAGLAANFKLNGNQRVSIKYANNSISWGLLRTPFYIKRLINGSSIKQIRKENKNLPIEIGGGIRIRYAFDFFLVHNFNFGYVFKI